MKRLIDLAVGDYFSTPLTRRWGRVIRIWRGVDKEGNPTGFCVAVELTKYHAAEINPEPELLPSPVWEAAQLHPNCLVIPKGA